MPNRLANQSSPYLLQHKDNPVDWYPWGDEAFAEAKRRGVPLLVSIGYSTCHWCHVMAHESFEDPVIAALMNQSFVNVKVDREERPDVDALYMQAVQVLGYSTGWPLNVFITPDGLPFFGGTYFPPQPRHGMASFGQVLTQLRDLWQSDREKIIRGGQEVAKHIITTSDANVSPSPVNAAIMQRMIRGLYEKFDKTNGGFGEAPKFPQPSTLDFLLRHYARTHDVAALSMVELTLGAMAEGGIYDQIGGGFARYSVDAEWHVPHFEKMLYDNAQLLPLYVDTYRHTQDPLYRTIVEETVAWLEREMLLPQGGYAAALDADSEGVEGKFYIWTAAEIDNLFDPEDADLLKLHFGISEPGTFEGATVLRVVKDEEELAEDLGVSLADLHRLLDALKQQMLEIRGKRVRPGRDDKAIASWNGLTIHALAYAGHALQNERFIDMARKAARFVARHLMAKDGSLARTWTNGKAGANGVLDDYANVIRGFLTLYNVTGEFDWLERAWKLTTYVQDHFRHDSGVGFYDTPDTATDLFVRPRDLTDAATPSGNATMAEVLQVLGTMRRDDKLTEQAQAIIESLAGLMPRFPTHTGTMAAAAERLLAPPRELVLVGDDVSRLRAAGSKRIDPLLIIGYVASGATGIGDWEFLSDRPSTDKPTAYWCTNFACQPPESDPERLVEVMRSI